MQEIHTHTRAVAGKSFPNVLTKRSIQYKYDDYSIIRLIFSHSDHCEIKTKEKKFKKKILKKKKNWKKKFEKKNFEKKNFEKKNLKKKIWKKKILKKKIWIFFF